jgi:hypothetical protein
MGATEIVVAVLTALAVFARQLLAPFRRPSGPRDGARP